MAKLRCGTSCSTVVREGEQFGNVLRTSWHGLDSRLLDLSVRGQEPRGAIDACLMIEGKEGDIDRGTCAC
jgi:endonuclease/exonuclease/phosphatase family metal-dependent hydrolase